MIENKIFWAAVIGLCVGTVLTILWGEAAGFGALAGAFIGMFWDA